MRLRTRLSLWIGLMIVVGSLASYVLRQYFVHEEKNEIEIAVEQLVEQSNEEDDIRRAKMMASIINNSGETLSTALDSINEWGTIKKDIEPSLANNQNLTWHTAGRLFAHLPSIDFIQITNEGKLTALIVPNRKELYHIHQKPLSQNRDWVMVDSKGFEGDAVGAGTYLGARFVHPNNLTNSSEKQQPPQKGGVYLLFLPEMILTLPPNYEFLLKNEEVFAQLVQQHFPQENASLLADTVFKEMTKAQNNLDAALAAVKGTSTEAFQEVLNQIIGHHEQLVENLQFLTVVKTIFGEPFVSPYQNLLEKGKSLAFVPEVLPPDFFTMTLQEISQYTNEINVGRNLDVILMAGNTESTPFAPQAPLGAVRIVPEEEIGLAVLVQNMFREEIFFNDAEYYEKNKPYEGEAPISMNLGLVDIAGSRRFLVQTLRLEHEEVIDGKKVTRTGYLTVGFFLNVFLQNIAQALREMVFISTENGISLQVIDQDGSVIPGHVIEAKFPVKEMTSQEKNTGSFVAEGKRYYFSRMEPLTALPLLHFFTVNSYESTFALKDKILASMDASNRKALYPYLGVSVLTLIVMLMILSRLALHITRPISVLAEASKEVALGNYGGTKIPEMPFRGRDEVAILAKAFAGMVRGLIDKEKIRTLLNKVVSKEIAEKILTGDIQLGGEERVVTVLFVDVRGFTKMTEHLSPQEVISFLNAFMTKMTHIIEKNEGVIDKYIGDEIMALYGAPVDLNEAPIKAIHSALQMVDKIREWNEERQQQGLPPVDIGIGIHRGNVVAGNMGAEDRLNYTVLGANVNLGARLCAGAQKMQILTTPNVAYLSEVVELFETQKLAPMKFKGFSEEIDIFEIKGTKKKG